ncbi:MAG TPA: SDR family oxidoreductase [Chroococcales cyanobacterium]|jgi:NAD(P)-dependent dehydrogenase (short-subunit alcohol dehydrogenase family)
MSSERVIVTGACGVLGSSVAQHLKETGFEVLETSFRLGHDLTDEEFVKAFFAENKADYLVNLFALNHHIDPGGEDCSLFNISLDSFRNFMEVNVTALFSACREFARNQEARGIVNFSSIYGLSSPIGHLYGSNQKHIGYSASKAAVIQLSRHLATHLAPRVRVNCIVPGGVENGQDPEFIEKYSGHTPLKRMMRRDEVNGLVGYLCSEGSSYMTGSVLTLDGGWTAW